MSDRGKRVHVKLETDCVVNDADDFLEGEFARIDNDVAENALLSPLLSLNCLAIFRTDAEAQLGWLFHSVKCCGITRRLNCW
jgi:hypothetical protein